MESSATLLNRARRSLDVAEQMLIRTYPVVRDPKLILAVAGDIYTALASSIEALAAKKGIDMAGFDSELDAFADFAAEYRFSDDDIELVKGIHSIMEAHKQSPVEFPRHDAFVICDDSYGMKRISVDEMKSFLFKAGLFVDKVEDVFRAK